MCSPFVMIVARRFGVAEGRHSPLAAQLWYTAGRIVTYSMLGALAGALGGLVLVAGGLVGVQRAAALVAGAALVAWAIVEPDRLDAARDDAWRVVRRRRRHLEGPGAQPSAGRRSVPRPAAVRAAYSAVVASVALGGPLQGAAALAAFGPAPRPRCSACPLPTRSWCDTAPP